jgi:ABC-type Mn2+/Zn2+ transport system ATPase subunit
MDRLRQERGTTILFISHDLGVVSRHAGQVLCLNKNIVCYGTPADVLNSTALARLYERTNEISLP